MRKEIHVNEQKAIFKHKILVLKNHFKYSCLYQSVIDICLLKADINLSLKPFENDVTLTHHFGIVMK